MVDMCDGTLSSSGGGTEEGTGGGGGRVSGGVSNPEELTGPANSGFKDSGAVCVAAQTKVKCNGKQGEGYSSVLTMVS